MNEFAPNYDQVKGYLESPANDLVHWKTFNHNVDSSEPRVEDVIELLKGFEDQLFDLRPYMIEQPIKCDQWAQLGDALELFKLHHMRHLLVVSPLDGHLVGILTRKDIHAFMKY